MPEPQWWSIYFANAKDQSLNFTIENHTDQTDFLWQVLVNKNITQEGDEQVAKGETKDVIIENNTSEQKKVIINVFSGEEKREIYKNL